MDNDFLKVLAFASALPCLIEDSGPRRGALMGAGSIFSSVHRQTAMGADVVSECGKANFKKSSRRNKGFSKAGNHK